MEELMNPDTLTQYEQFVECLTVVKEGQQEPEQEEVAEDGESSVE